MLALKSDMPIWLCTQPTDMRRSFDGLSAQVRRLLLESPSSGALFVFINRRRTQMKCLYFESGGYCLWSKRLEQGQFALPSKATIVKQPLQATEFLSLIEGIDLLITRRRKRYKPGDKLSQMCYSPPI
jgi:transposase